MNIFCFPYSGPWGSWLCRITFPQWFSTIFDVNVSFKGQSITVFLYWLHKFAKKWDARHPSGSENDQVQQENSNFGHAIAKKSIATLSLFLFISNKNQINIQLTWKFGIFPIYLINLFNKGTQNMAPDGFSGFLVTRLGRSSTKTALLVVRKLLSFR